MNKLLMKTMLFDFYGELLTDKQKTVYELHYLNDLSLNEIGEQFNITRQAVQDMLTRTSKTLEHYESRLHLIEKHEKQKELSELAFNIINSSYGKHESASKQLKDIISAISEGGS